MDTSYLRKLALIVGVSVGALVLGLNRGEYRLPPQDMLQAVLRGDESRDGLALAMGILPGFGAQAGFMMGAGATAPLPANVFATALYTGTNAAQSITNGINLSSKGGWVLTKGRDSTANWVSLDTVRGDNYFFLQNSGAQQSGGGKLITSYNSNGYTLGNDSTLNNVNSATINYVSWSFAKNIKFFDIQTFTAGTNANRRISHNLGVAPGMIILRDYANAGAVPKCRSSIM